MSSQYGRLCMVRDRAHPITPDKTVEVLASDLDAVISHYAALSDRCAWMSAALAEVRDWDVSRATDNLKLSGSIDFALPQRIREHIQAALTPNYDSAPS